jgi:hypothetical protein
MVMLRETWSLFVVQRPVFALLGKGAAWKTNRLSFILILLSKFGFVPVVKKQVFNPIMECWIVSKEACVVYPPVG